MNGKALLLFLITLLLYAGTTLPGMTASPASTRKNTVQEMRYINTARGRFLLLNDVCAYYNLKLQFTKTGALLYSKYSRIEFEYNKRSGTLNGLSVFFQDPLLIRGNRTYIAERDFRYVLDPILRKRSLTRLRNGVIMLDPGHGGKDRGAKGPVLDEKVINLQLALKLKTALEKRGFKVIMTRNSDVFPSLQDRSELCEKLRPDLYISIHCNSTTTGTIKGIETYAMTPQGSASTSDTTPVKTVSPGNRYNQNNYRLAYEVQKSLLNATRREDRGVRHARFYVLRNAVCPSILIECGFLSHAEEGKALAWSRYQNTLVAAMELGILRYCSAVR